MRESQSEHGGWREDSQQTRLESRVMKCALLRSMIFTLRVVEGGPWIEECRYYQSHDWVAGGCIGGQQERKMENQYEAHGVIQGKC